MCEGALVFFAKLALIVFLLGLFRLRRLRPARLGDVGNTMRELLRYGALQSPRAARLTSAAQYRRKDGMNKVAQRLPE